MSERNEQLRAREVDFDLSEIVLDEDVIEAKALQCIPDEVRDNWLWLARYYRDQCSENPLVLNDRFKKVGVYRDTGTWHKILKGQISRLHDGRVRPHPVVALDKFAAEVGCLRSNTRVETLSGRVPFVATGTSLTIMSYLDLKRSPERVNRFGVIVGPTGSQKTATFKEYIRRRAHPDTFWVEAPETGTMGEFLVSLAMKLGASGREQPTRARKRIFEKCGTASMLIVDNTQRLHRASREGEQPLFGFLQRLQDETGCAVALSITPTFERTLTSGMERGFFEQFEGRAGGRQNFLRLSDYAPPEDVVQIAQAFGLKSAAKHEKLLVELSRRDGRIRILFEVLQDAKLHAPEDQDGITINDIKTALEEQV